MKKQLPIIVLIVMIVSIVWIIFLPSKSNKLPVIVHTDTFVVTDKDYTTGPKPFMKNYYFSIKNSNGMIINLRVYNHNEWEALTVGGKVIVDYDDNGNLIQLKNY